MSSRQRSRRFKLVDTTVPTPDRTRWLVPALAAFSVISLGPWGYCLSHWAKPVSGARKFAPASLATSQSPMVGRTGPWGQLICTPVSLEPPGNFTDVDEFNTYIAPRWLFKGYTRDQVMSLFRNASISDAQLSSPASGTWETDAGGIIFRPSSDFVLGLSTTARAQIYGVLDDFPENEAQRTPYSFKTDDLNEILAQSGLKPETQQLLRSLLYPQGDSLLFADIGLLMSRIPDHDEKVRLFKTICHRPSLKVALRVDANTDIDQVIDYWKAGSRAEEMKPLLTALGHIDGGGTIDLTHLLPKFVEDHVYTFPDASKDATVEHRDCHWTTLNFFGAKPDDHFADPATVRKTFDTEYAPVTSEPSFGDAVLLVNQSNVLVHSATYLADDVVFTKNGGIFTQPWTSMKLSDLVSYYNTFTPPSEPLKVIICRRRAIAG